MITHAGLEPMHPASRRHITRHLNRSKFHYAVQLARSATSSLAGRRPANEQDSVMEYDPNLCATRLELSRHAEIARACLRQVGNQVCDLLASWI